LAVGGFNLHPALLPQYAGLNSASWAIYHGETEHGVTIHRMEADVDTGPIVFQERIPIAHNETGLSLSVKCVRTGVRLMLRLADVAARNPASIPCIPQDLSKRQYFGRGAPQRGRIAWNRPAARIWNFVRACDYRPLPSPWGTPLTRAAGRDVGIVAASITQEAATEPPGTVRHREGQSVEVACADTWLAVESVRLDGRVQAAANVLRSGQVLGDGSDIDPRPDSTETSA
jgi:methionyl-tRNA formyltransferase